MAKYNLTSAIEKTFDFDIDEYQFRFKKPTVREMKVVAKAFSGIDENASPDEQAAKSEEAMRELYQFISPVGHDKYIGDVMEDQPMQVQLGFNEMVQTELGAK